MISAITDSRRVDKRSASTITISVLVDALRLSTLRFFPNLMVVMLPSQVNLFRRF
jgi:hypothetical protein